MKSFRPLVAEISIKTQIENCVVSNCGHPIAIGVTMFVAMFATDWRS
jgi:hypothetical protein